MTEEYEELAIIRKVSLDQPINKKIVNLVLGVRTLIGGADCCLEPEKALEILRSSGLLSFSELVGRSCVIKSRGWGTGVTFVRLLWE